jgi:glycosyltransferase involved in cell wall biosynthesis
MMPRQALMISYYFPPLGMGGVQRMSKLAKYLPQFGYDVSVLTVKPISYLAHDPTLLDELPAQVKIYRSGSIDPARIAHLLHLPLRSVAPSAPAMKRQGAFWPDSKTGWKRSALRLAEKIHSHHPVDIVLSSSPPITAHLIAGEFKRRHNIPWVADFRDLWESYAPEKLYAEQGTIEKSYKLLNDIAGNADAVTSVNDTIGRRISEEAIAIGGGYDPDDFSPLPAPAKNDRFVLCHLGTVGPLHPIEPFFEAVSLASAKDPEFARQSEFLIIGANDKRSILRAAAPFDLDKKIIFTGYLPHREALKRATQSSILLLSIPADYPDLLTGKIFDCLALGIPILASAPPEGEAARLIFLRRGGICASPGNINDLADALAGIYAQWQRGNRAKKADLTGLSRRDSAAQFAEIFDRVIRDHK